MSPFLHSLKHSVRTFLKSPGFTIAAVTALALGIGATTAIFSIVNTVMLKPLPGFDSDGLVQLMTVNTTQAGGSDANPVASPARFAHWRAQSSVLQYVTAFHGSMMNYTEGGNAEPLPSMQASADTFRCFGMAMLIGR